MNRPSHADCAEKLLALAGLTFAIELIFFKFLPDVATAVIQGHPSNLTDFDLYHRDYLQLGTLSYTRFLGNQILWRVAQIVGSFVHSQDVRLHPLRIAAGILTPLYACIGAWPGLRARFKLNWRFFMAAYAAMVVISLYQFYPYDMPALAMISVSLYFLLKGEMRSSLVFMLLTGIFRETSFHVVTWVGLWMICDRGRPLRDRVLWFGTFTLAFIAEYKLLRHFYPGPLTGDGHLVLDAREIFFGRGTLSLTVICSLGLESVFALICFGRIRKIARDDWRRSFFIANCVALPAWWIFYRIMNGNLAEFRLLMPALIPVVYGMAYMGRTSARPAAQLGT